MVVIHTAVQHGDHRGPACCNCAFPCLYSVDINGRVGRLFIIVI